MDLETLFTMLNVGVLPFWLLLAFAPRWAWTQRLTHAVWVAAIYAPIYAWLLVSGAGGDGDFSSLAGVGALFRKPEALLAGWIHYLVFDLFVGAWISRDAIRRDLPQLVVVPCLFFTLMFGPVGLAAYAALRGAMRRTATLVEGEV